MLRRMGHAVRVFHAAQEGAAMVEYAIVTAGIAVVALVAVQAVGSAIVSVFNGIVSALSTV